MLTPTRPKVRVYPHQYFVTVTTKLSKRTTTMPFPDEATASIYMTNMQHDPLFLLASTSFDWHVTFAYDYDTGAEATARFNEISGAEDFIERADGDPNLVVIEYNFVSSV